MKKVVAACVIVLLAGCTARPVPAPKVASEGRLGAGDSLGLSLSRTDQGVTRAREKAYAVHPED